MIYPKLGCDRNSDLRNIKTNISEFNYMDYLSYPFS